MKIIVFGMMRSGTTLICDLLSAPNRSLIFSEPMMFDTWSDFRAHEVHAAAKAFGLPIPDAPPEKGQFDTIASYFEDVLEPQLENLDFWGFKEVYFHNWRRILDHFRPDRLVLCVRDIRDVTLSALDLIVNSKLAFPGGRRLRDEAWLVGRLCFDVQQLFLLRSYSHLLVRYEDLVGKAETRAQLAEFAGLSELSTGSLHRSLSTAGSRTREVEKHGQGISSLSLARFERETSAQALALMNHIHRVLTAYAVEFGYSDPDPSTDARQATGNGTPSPSWRDVEDWQSAGPPQFDPAFALRRGRHVVARNIRAGTKVVEVGCLLPSLMTHLPEGCSYVGLGDKAHPPFIRAADWSKGSFPDLSPLDLIVLVGSLEFVEDVRIFLKALKSTGKEILLTYHATDDTPGLDRRDFGWRNDLDRKQIVNAFEDNGFRVTYLWAFDGRQSLFRLRP